MEPGITLLTGQDVSSVEPAGEGFSVAAGGELYQAGYLALAVPPPAASGLLKAAHPALSSHLSKVKVGHVETVGVALHKDEVHAPPVAGIIASGDCFFSAVSRDTVKDEKFRGFAFHFKPGLLDIDAKLGRIGEVLKVRPAAIRQYVEKDNNFVPSLTSGHAGWAAEADRLIGGSRLLLTGNYFGGVAIEDCVSRSFYEFVRTRKAA
jgi:protoporphyrinogen oxidase